MLKGAKAYLFVLKSGSNAVADQNLTDIIDVTVRAVRERWDPLGYVEAESAFATGHTPSVAPMAYLCRFYAGLDDAALGDAEGEAKDICPQSTASS